MTAQPGRPRKEEADKREGTFQIRRKDSELAAWQEAAEIAGLDASAWARSVLNEAAAMLCAAGEAEQKARRADAHAKRWLANKGVR